MKFMFTGVFLIYGCVLSTSVTFSAQIQGAEIPLCNGGYRAYSVDTNSVSCVSYTAGGNCPSGYWEYPANTETFIGLYGNRCAMSTYQKKTMPDTITSLTYHGLVSGSEITLCDQGYYSYSSGTPSCVSYAKGSCDNGYWLFSNNADTFIGVYDNKCVLSTYKKKPVPDTLVDLTYHGTTSGSEITLCNGGYAGYIDGATSCRTYDDGYCWDGYYALPAGSTTFNEPTSGACASGAHTYSATACGYAPTTDTCLDVCGDGQMYTGVNTCASLCESGATTLRTSTGLIIPMWSEKQISPSINIGLTGGVCYVNLSPGTTSEHAVMVQYDNNTYHTTQ